MALADILAALAGVVSSAGASNVYTFRPLIKSGAAITDSLKVGGVVHFWGVTRSSTRETRLTSFEVQRNHTIDMHGHAEVGDAGTTEPAFQVLVDRIMEDLRGIYRLQPPASVEILGPPQAQGLDAPRLLGDTYLVHYVQITVDAQELVRV